MRNKARRAPIQRACLALVSRAAQPTSSPLGPPCASRSSSLTAPRAGCARTAVSSRGCAWGGGERAQAHRHANRVGFTGHVVVGERKLRQLSVAQRVVRFLHEAHGPFHRSARVRRLDSLQALPKDLAHHTTSGPARANTRAARQRGQGFERPSWPRVGHAASHRSFTCVGCRSTRGRPLRSHEPPPASPRQRHPAARSDAPPSSGSVYVTSLRYPSARAARHEAP